MAIAHVLVFLGNIRESNQAEATTEIIKTGRL